MTDETANTRRFHPLLWLGWILALLFLAAAAGFAHHIAWMRAQLDSAQGQNAQLRLQLQHADQLADVLTSPQASHFVLTETRQPSHPVGQVSWLPAKGALVFMAAGLRPLPPDKTYELWLVPSEREAPIPAGLFRPNADRGANVVLPPLPANTTAQRFLVTVEPAHGSETPSLPMILQGQ